MVVHISYHSAAQHETRNHLHHYFSIWICSSTCPGVSLDKKNTLCDPSWENVPNRVDKFFSELALKKKL